MSKNSPQLKCFVLLERLYWYSHFNNIYGHASAHGTVLCNRAHQHLLLCVKYTWHLGGTGQLHTGFFWGEGGT
jgi:hypothetical protein